MEVEQDKHVGTVKFFDDARGFGFIEGLDGGQFFVHRTSIQSRGYRTLQVGESVEFDTVEAPKGPQAISVVILN